jgi:hypothetical protein
MSRQANIGKEEIERAKQMRDESMSINQYRKALSVILIGKLVSCQRYSVISKES